MLTHRQRLNSRIDQIVRGILQNIGGGLFLESSPGLFIESAEGEDAKGKQPQTPLPLG